MSNHNEKNELNSGKLLTSSVEDNPEPSQICLICKRELPYVFFHKSSSNKNRLDYRCKDCKKELAYKNRIKYNATIEELENILTYMKGATTILKRSTS